MTLELGAWELPATFPDLAGQALLDAVEELCDRRQGLHLATPYLTFASRFLGAEGQTLRIRATMGRSVVERTLSHQQLTLRFPWGLTQYAGPTRILDYVQDDAGKHLKVAQPARFTRDDQRRAYRTDHPGRSLGAALDASGTTFARFHVENLSTSGMAVFCTDPIQGSAFAPHAKISVEVALDQGPEFTATARIVHASGQTLGLAFTPPLASALDKVAQWLQPRFEEAQRRWENRASLRAQAERAAAPRPAPAGVLLVTSDPGLPGEVAEALAGSQEVRTVAPVLGPYREAVDLRPPHLVLLSCSGTLEECHRLKALLERAHTPCPLVVVNLGAPSAGVRAFALEIRATMATERPARQGVFFRRLVLGLIRKQGKVAP